MDTAEPITNQEIPIVADRVARGLVAYLLAEGRNFLGDAIYEALGDDPDASRLDSHTRDTVYGLVWDQLGRAVAEYQPRDQVLTEAAELLRQHRGDLETLWWDSRDRDIAINLLLAARTTQEACSMADTVQHFHWGRSWHGTPIEDACRCPQAPCGLVDTATVDQDCDQHGIRFAKTRRQGHAAEQCPAAVQGA